MDTDDPKEDGSGVCAGDSGASYHSRYFSPGVLSFELETTSRGKEGSCAELEPDGIVSLGSLDDGSASDKEASWISEAVAGSLTSA